MFFSRVSNAIRDLVYPFGRLIVLRTIYFTADLIVAEPASIPGLFLFLLGYAGLPVVMQHFGPGGARGICFSLFAWLTDGLLVGLLGLLDLFAVAITAWAG